MTTSLGLSGPIPPYSAVVLSYIEAEYTSLSETVKEAQWVMRLVNGLYIIKERQLHGVSKVAQIICSSNEAALIVSKNPELHKKAKHIDIKHAKARDEYEAGNIWLNTLDLSLYFKYSRCQEREMRDP